MVLVHKIHKSDVRNAIGRPVFPWFCMATDKQRKTSTWAFGVAPMCAHLAIELVTCKANLPWIFCSFNSLQYPTPGTHILILVSCGDQTCF